MRTLKATEQRPVMILVSDKKGDFGWWPLRLMTDRSARAVYKTAPQAVILVDAASVARVRKALASPCVAVTLSGRMSAVTGCGCVDQAPGLDYAAVYRLDEAVEDRIMVGGLSRPNSIRILDPHEWAPRP